MTIVFLWGFFFKGGWLCEQTRSFSQQGNLTSELRLFCRLGSGGFSWLIGGWQPAGPGSVTTISCWCFTCKSCKGWGWSMKTCRYVSFFCTVWKGKKRKVASNGKTNTQGDTKPGLGRQDPSLMTQMRITETIFIHIFRIQTHFQVIFVCFPPGECGTSPWTPQTVSPFSNSCTLKKGFVENVPAYFTAPRKRWHVAPVVFPWTPTWRLNHRNFISTIFYDLVLELRRAAKHAAVNVFLLPGLTLGVSQFNLPSLKQWEFPNH